MSRFRKLSHTIWHCQYHIIWVPKYRYRILAGNVGESMANGIQAICGYAGCEVNELNVRNDHVHLVAMVPPQGIDIGFDGAGQRTDLDENV